MEERIAQMLEIAHRIMEEKREPTEAEPAMEDSPLGLEASYFEPEPVTRTPSP